MEYHRHFQCLGTKHQSIPNHLWLRALIGVTAIQNRNSQESPCLRHDLHRDPRRDLPRVLPHALLSE